MKKRSRKRKRSSSGGELRKKNRRKRSHTPSSKHKNRGKLRPSEATIRKRSVNKERSSKGEVKRIPRLYRFNEKKALPKKVIKLDFNPSTSNRAQNPEPPAPVINNTIQKKENFATVSPKMKELVNESISNGNYDGGLQILNEIITTKNIDPKELNHLLFQKMICLKKQKEYQSSFEQLEHILNNLKDNGDDEYATEVFFKQYHFHYELGFVLQKLGKFQDSIKYLTHEIENYSFSASYRVPLFKIYITLAESYFNLTLYPQAIRNFSLAIDILKSFVDSDDYSFALYRRGIANEMIGNYKQCCFDFELVLAQSERENSFYKEKKKKEIRLKIVKALYSLRRYNECILRCDQVLAKDKRNLIGLFFKGKCLIESKRFSKSLEPLCLIIYSGNNYNASSPSSPEKMIFIEALKLIALAYFNIKNFAKSIEFYTRVTALAPRDCVTWFYLGELHKTQKNYSEALRCLEQALKIDPRHIQSLTSIEQVKNFLITSRQQDEEIRISKEFEVLELEGQNYLKNKKYGKAKEVYENLLFRSDSNRINLGFIFKYCEEREMKGIKLKKIIEMKDLEVKASKEQVENLMKKKENYKLSNLQKENIKIKKLNKKIKKERSEIYEELIDLKEKHKQLQYHTDKLYQELNEIRSTPEFREWDFVQKLIKMGKKKKPILPFRTANFDFLDFLDKNDPHKIEDDYVDDNELITGRLPIYPQNTVNELVSLESNSEEDHSDTQNLRSTISPRREKESPLRLISSVSSDPGSIKDHTQPQFHMTENKEYSHELRSLEPNDTLQVYPKSQFNLPKSQEDSNELRSLEPNMEKIDYSGSGLIPITDNMEDTNALRSLEPNDIILDFNTEAQFPITENQEESDELFSLEPDEVDHTKSSPTEVTKLGSMDQENNDNDQEITYPLFSLC